MTNAELPKLRDEMVAVARLMHQRGLVGGMDGNLSARVGRDRVLCTPSGSNKGFLRPQDLLLVDLDGTPLRRGTSPSSEILMHLKAYEKRSDVAAVVHAHPPHAVACTLVGITLTDVVVPELAFSLGAVPTAAYATPGTPEVAQSLEPHIERSDAILLARHGAMTVGKDLWQAYNRMEGLEHAAHILFLARNLGDLVPLGQGELQRLRDSVEARGIPWKMDVGAEGGFPSDLMQAIIEQVLARLTR